ncbi:sulfurtransferase TusA [Teredinibacter purpureus]|uniref:sulfurtransferase TusA n=1 Tax=Teredinibacter purpureus TaxID=2731756 RepID=UPI0005F7D915|nr:sulfurtransferase TusA [Teredinibacter purpureus]
MSGPEVLVDACGLTCPEPVMMLHNAVRDAATGDLIKIIATDPSTVRDITRFCDFLGHHLDAHEEKEGQFTFWVRKG